MAKPGYEWTEKKEVRLTTDTVLCLDISKSMDAPDFTPSRLAVAKREAEEFIDKMQGNRMAIVLFSGFAFTQSPLTFDLDILKGLLEDVNTDMIRINGTAIGDAIGVAINRLKGKDVSKEKVIVLLTDGDNNRGTNPMEVAKIAKKLGIKIYTIGIGTKEGYTFNFGWQQATSRLNDKLLKSISQLTGGKYYYGYDEESIKNAYDDIAQLEKQKVVTKSHRVFYPKYRTITFILLLFLILDFIILYFRKLYFL